MVAIVTLLLSTSDELEDRFIQVRAINCAGESDNTSAIFTGIYYFIMLRLKISAATLTTSGDDMLCSMSGYTDGDSGTTEMDAITSGITN